MGAQEIIDSAWRTLRLGVRCPARQPTWDAILVTAASPDQARLYRLHLQRAVDRGRISRDTLVLAVPDPQGRRIGSGGATLGAIRELDAALRSKGGRIWGKRVLLVHAGGDSKRVPWANAIGKAFVPVPICGCPDEPSALLFDHILAVSSLAASQLPDRGGLLIMTGDVLPFFDAANMILPMNGALVVTVPTSLEVAANHGIVLSRNGDDNKAARSCCLVDDLLQKPSADEMYNRGAVSSDSTALLDTGIFVVVGDAWEDLIGLSVAEIDPIQVLLDNDQEMSLYEEVAGAWVLARHKWLQDRPLGKVMIDYLGAHRLYHYCAYELKFLHFGTTSEILQHMASEGSGSIQRRQFTSAIIQEAVTRFASTSVILDSQVDDCAAVGDGSLVFNSSLSSKMEVGSGCVVLGVDHTEDSPEFLLPDNHCLWEVPLKGDLGRIMLCCGVGDNPKLPTAQGGTFCGKTWDEKLGYLQIQKDQIWGDGIKQQDLWHAKLFPIQAPEERKQNFLFALWLMEVHSGSGTNIASEWLAAQRLSFAELQEFTDFEKMHAEMGALHAKLATGFARSNLEDGVMDRNFNLLAREIVLGSPDGSETCRKLLSQVPDQCAVPISRMYQVRADLSRGFGDKTTLARIHETNAFQAVVAETSAAVCQGETRLLRLQPSRASTVNLPVRLDIVGGWSDTPPWSVERRGCVLNMAVNLNGAAPVVAEVLLKTIPGVSLRDDLGHRCWIDEPTTLTPPFDVNDPFRLVKAALVVTGWTSQTHTSTMSPWGLEITTRAAVPRGSGLGTSSILAAAVIKALLEVSGGNSSRDNVAAQVLVLEQLMGTGGGWQDQVGGIYPGLKCTTSLPTKPLAFSIETIRLPPDLSDELENRMLLVFTGQVRLAHKVLHKVVKRYLQRDSLLLSSIERLVTLAKSGQEAFLRRDLDFVGRIMKEAWQTHQELDAFCSNGLVDAIFKSVDHLCCGCKLVGAGGGGFAILMAKDRPSAQAIKSVLSSSFGGSIEFYTWTLVSAHS